METRKKNKQQQQTTMTRASNGAVSQSASASQAFVLHLLCGLGLASAFWAAHNVYSINLLDNPAQTLRLLWMTVAPIVILFYSLFRHQPDRCSYLKAVGRGVLGLPAGAVVNALAAIVLGAPAIQYHEKTINWSLLMSAFTFVPAACVFGSSWIDWQRIFAYAKPIESVDYMICLPAHGAVIGAWFGAWPMPLDWERPWQEWPVCVSYGALLGYLIGMVASYILVLCHVQPQRVKAD